MSNDLQEEENEQCGNLSVFEMIGAMGGKEPPSTLLLGQMPRRATDRSQPQLLSEEPCRTPFEHNQRKTLFPHNQWVAKLPLETAHLGEQFRKRPWTRWVPVKLKVDIKYFNLIVKS